MTAMEMKLKLNVITEQITSHTTSKTDETDYIGFQLSVLNPKPT